MKPVLTVVMNWPVESVVNTPSEVPECRRSTLAPAIGASSAKLRIAPLITYESAPVVGTGSVTHGRFSEIASGSGAASGGAASTRTGAAESPHAASAAAHTKHRQICMTP